MEFIKTSCQPIKQITALLNNTHRQLLHFREEPIVGHGAGSVPRVLFLEAIMGERTHGIVLPIVLGAPPQWPMRCRKLADQSGA